MAICKDCVHVEVCISYLREAYKRAHLATPDLNSVLSLRCDDCEHFKDRSQFVELPCEAYITIHGEVEQIHLFGCYGRYGINETSRIIRVEPFCFGKILFFTREEAEQALKEREENA